MIFPECPGTQLRENFSNHSREMASKVSAVAASSARFFALGWIPSASSRRAASRRSLACFKLTSG